MARVKSVAIKQPKAQVQAEKIDVSDLTLKMNSSQDSMFIADPVVTWGKHRGEQVAYTLQQVDTSASHRTRNRNFDGLPYIDGNGTLIIPKEAGVNRASVFEPSINGGSIMNLFGLKLCLPRYPLYRVHGFMSASPWHFACIEAKATAATELGYSWRPVGSDSYKRKPRISADQFKRLKEFEDRIYETNHVDLSSILKAIAVDFFACGNLFVELTYTPLGRIDSLYAIPAISCFRLYDSPAICQILPVDEMGLQPTINSLSIIESAMAVIPLFKNDKGDNYIKSHLSSTAYSNVFKPNSRVIHEMNSIISTDPYYGVADVIPALSAILGDVASNDYNLQFFQHNAVPRYAVILKGGRVTEDNKQNILRFLNESVYQQHHRTIVIPLGRGIEAEFKALDVAPNEASFLKFKEMNRAEILAVHRVPPMKVGMWDDANRSNGIQQADEFHLSVIRPFQVRIERMMNRILADMGITEYEFKFNDVSWEDDKAKATVQHVMAMSANVRVGALTQAQQLVSELINSKAIDKERGAALLQDVADRLESAFDVSWKLID